MRRIAVLGVTLAALAFAGAGSSGPQRTILTESGPIRSFAQEAGRIGWTVYRAKARCFSAVVNADLHGMRRQTMSWPKGPTCRDETGFQDATPVRFALAGNEALWVLSSSGNDVYDFLVHGAVGRRDREIRLFQYSAGTYDGDRLGEVAGAGTTLLYGWYRVVLTSDACYEGGGDCRWDVYPGGSVRRVVGSRSIAVPGAPAATLVSTTGERVALVPAHGEADETGVPLDRRDVEVREVRTGRLLSSFRAARNVLDLALGDGVVAVLLAAPRRIERYDAAMGRRLGATSVPREAASLDASGTRLVFAAGRRIELLQLDTGRVRTLVVAGARPIGLSVDGARVSWAENVGGRGVVRSLTLP